MPTLPNPFDSGAPACAPDEAAAPFRQTSDAAVEYDDPYGVGPCMLNDLPLIRSENERKRRELLEQRETDCIGEIFAGAARLDELDDPYLFELDPGNQKYRGMRKPRLDVAGFMDAIDEPPLFLRQATG